MPFLDVLRGIAILGILPANLPYFAFATERAGEPGESWGDLLAYHVTRFFVDCKFITIFSFLFGVGMMIARERSTAEGHPRLRTLLRRLGILFGLGLGHALLLWYGDIVAAYALLGLLISMCTRWTPRKLARVGVGLLLVPVVAMALIASLLFAFQDEPQIQELLERFSADSEPAALTAAAAASGTWEEFGASLMDWSPKLEEAVYREGTFLRITVLRAVTWAISFLAIILLVGWRLVGLMLLGMAWAKDGWLLRPAENLPRFARMVCLGLWLGIPLHAVSLALMLCGWGGLAGTVLAELTLYLGSLGLSASYAGLAAFFTVTGSWRRTRATLAAVGRTAFSNYLLQSLLGSFIFYSYGLALFGSLDRPRLWCVAALIWALQLLVSPLWLHFFRFGPVEWLWRSLTYGRWQPLRRSGADHLPRSTQER